MLLLAGCGGTAGRSSSPAGPSGGRSGSGPAGSITVFAAASLTGTFTALGRGFEAAQPGTRVRFDFGSSSTLAQQVAEGAPADVFAAASGATIKPLASAGEVAGVRTFARNSAEIAVYPPRARVVRSVADLARPGVSVALCQPQVPCGALAETALAAAKVPVSPVTRGLDVKAVLATVAAGEVDAGIVYVTDVKAAGAKVAGVALPPAAQVRTDYPIAVVTRSRNRALATAFADFVLSAAGRRTLTDAGFTVP